MRRVVLDSSYALALALPDEAPPESRDEVLANALIAPHLFPLEIANAALNTVRRRRYRAEEADEICQAIEGLGIEVLGPPDFGPRQHLRMALAHGLSAYDTLYLDLALTSHCPLATCDAALGAAARRVGIEVLS